MMNLDGNTEVAQYVTERPSLATLFEELGIDYCCGGHQSLQAACQQRGLSLDQVLCQIGQGMREPSEPNLQSLTPAELVAYIVERYHESLRRTLPVLTHQLERVVSAHGRDQPELLEIQQVFHEFSSEMMEHMQKEEQILFPLIAGSLQQVGCKLSNIIDRMESEHDSSAQALSKLRHLTRGYAIPDGACQTYRSAMSGLAELEKDTHQHVHAENHILFPQALAAAGR